MVSDQNEIAYNSKGIGVSTLESIEEAFKYNSWLVSRILPWLGEKNLELGAGTGTISELISKYKNVDLTEVSPACIDFLKLRFKNNNQVKILNTDYFNVQDKYDSIYSSNVLEHVEDDTAYLAQADKILNVGGHFVALVPGHQFLLSDFDKKIGHLRRYGKSNIKRIENELKKSSVRLRLVSARHYNPVGGIGWFLKMKLMRQSEIKLKDVLMMEKFVPILKKLDCLNFGFGQNFVFVFEKY